MKEVGISQVDAIFSSGIYPIEFLFYYSERFETKWLRRSLRQLSSDFWPVFGVFYMPATGDLFQAQAGNKAFRGKEEIRISAQESINDVWDANYMVVHHFNVASGWALDSTSRGIDTYISGGTPTYREACSLTGYGMGFPYQSHHQMSDNGAFHTNNDYTIEAVANPDSKSDAGGFICAHGTGGSD